MKFVNSMLVAAYLLIVGLTAWSLVQNFGIKEVSVEAEVKEILSVEYPGRLDNSQPPNHKKGCPNSTWEQPFLLFPVYL